MGNYERHIKGHHSTSIRVRQPFRPLMQIDLSQAVVTKRARALNPLLVSFIDVSQ